MARFNAGGERHEGEGPFAYVKLTRLWHQVRLGGCGAAIAIGFGFTLSGLTVQGGVVFIGGLIALADTWHRIGDPAAALWPSFLIDAALIAFAAPLAGLPPSSLLAAFGYLGTAALFFVDARKALLLLIGIGGALLASGAVASATGLADAQTSVAISLAGGVTWTVFLLGLVFVATRAVNAIHTEREDTRRQLEGLMRAKDEFVATISHELRTPMTAVLGLAQQLRDFGDLFSPEEREEFIGMVADQAEEATTIVEDLLVAARLEEGEVKVQPTRIDLTDEVASVLRSHSWSDQILHDRDGEASAFADAARVRQIIRNLVTNAQRYGGPTINVSTSPGRVTVRDDGPGIPPGDVDLVFLPYGRSGIHDHGSRSVGLGLYVSRKLARLMGGDLTYEAAGGWTSFHLVVPEPSGVVSPV